MNLYLSLKLLFSLKKKTFHFFFLLLSFLGIFIGIFSLLLIISFMDSAQSKIRYNYLKKEAHIYIEPKQGSYFNEDKDFEHKLKKIIKNEKIIKKLKTQGFYQDFKGKIEGRSDVNKITIPFGKIGQNYCFTIPEITLGPFGPILKKICLKKEENGTEIYIPLIILQNLLNKKDKISSFEIFLNNSNEINKIYKEIKNILPENLKIQTIFEKKAPIIYALKLEKKAMIFAVFLILFVSIFQLYFSLKLLFYHYQTSWALLKVFGIGTNDIRIIFNLFCFYIFFLASIFGFLVSMVFLKIQNIYHFFPFPVELEHFKFINYKIPYLEFLLIFLFLIFTSFFIGNFIGNQAKKINIQEILRVPK